MTSIEPSEEELEAIIEHHPSGMTLDQIAEVLHCSKQRAKQLVDRAIGKVLNQLARRGIRSHYDVLG